MTTIRATRVRAKEADMVCSHCNRFVAPKDAHVSDQSRPWRPGYVIVGCSAEHLELALLAEQVERVETMCRFLSFRPG